MSDWTEPEWWNDDLTHEQARMDERARKERILSDEPVERREEDPELVENTTFASNVPAIRSTSFLRLRGDMEEKVSVGAMGTADPTIDRFFERVPTDDYWPSEESSGSTFRFSAWVRQRDYLL